MKEAYQKTIRRFRAIDIIGDIFLLIYGACLVLEAFLAVDLSTIRIVAPIAWLLIYAIVQNGMLKENPHCPHCDADLLLIDGLAFCTSCGERVFEDVPRKPCKPVKHIVSRKTAHCVGSVLLILMLVFLVSSIILGFLDVAVSWKKIGAIALIGIIIISEAVSFIIRKHCVCPHCVGKLPPQKQKDNYCPHCGEKIE